MSPYIMTEHAAWRREEASAERLFALPDGSRWMAVTDRYEVVLTTLAGDTTKKPAYDLFALPPEALTGVPQLQHALQNLGPVQRFRNPDLWDAIGTAIIRQVIRAGQATKLYRTFSEAIGERIELPNGRLYACFPTAEVVLSVSDDQFAKIGMSFKRRPLRAAAEAYLEFGAKWRELPPEDLVDELQRVPRIGPWTAGAAVSDWSNAWELYPYSDLAVRTWAKRAAPAHSWPNDEAAFGEQWRQLTGDGLGPITLLTLAWGTHNGDTG